MNPFNIQASPAVETAGLLPVLPAGDWKLLINHNNNHKSAVK